MKNMSKIIVAAIFTLSIAMFATVSSAHEGAMNPCAKANPCAKKMDHDMKANPCAKKMDHDMKANPCAKKMDHDMKANPCAKKNPCDK